MLPLILFRCEDGVDPNCKNAKKVAPMYKQETGGLLERLINKLEKVWSQPAQIEWKELTMSLSSQLGPLGAQSLVFTDVRNDSLFFFLERALHVFH